MPLDCMYTAAHLLVRGLKSQDTASRVCEYYQSGLCRFRRKTSTMYRHGLLATALLLLLPSVQSQNLTGRYTPRPFKPSSSKSLARCSIHADQEQCLSRHKTFPKTQARLVSTGSNMKQLNSHLKSLNHSPLTISPNSTLTTPASLVSPKSMLRPPPTKKERKLLANTCQAMQLGHRP